MSIKYQVSSIEYQSLTKAPLDATSCNKKQLGSYDKFINRNSLQLRSSASLYLRFSAPMLCTDEIGSLCFILLIIIYKDFAYGTLWQKQPLLCKLLTPKLSNLFNEQSFTQSRIFSWYLLCTCFRVVCDIWIAYPSNYYHQCANSYLLCNAAQLLFSWLLLC